MRLLICAMLLTLPFPLAAQNMRNEARRLGGSVDGMINITIGIASPTELLESSDLVLRGVVMSMTPRLSEDESRVVTDYTIRPSRVIKPVDATEAARQQSITLRMSGGTVFENGLRMSTTVDLYPESESLALGEDVVLFLLHSKESAVYNLNGGPFGAFRVVAGQAIAMTKETASRRGDAPVEVAAFLSDLAALAK